MDKRTKVKNCKALDGDLAKKILQEIVVDCIHEGRKLHMNSSEILDAVCDTLREHGLDALEE
jgi:hypothetical protein